MFDFSSLPIGFLWIAAGLFLVVIEWLAAPGMGLGFAGSAAAIVGLLVEFGLLDAMRLEWQGGLWIVLTLGLGILLHRRLEQWRRPPALAVPPDDLIGAMAVVTGGDLVRGQVGRAVWSGVTLLAEIDPMADAVRLNDGDTAEIVHLRGDTLYLRPRGSRRPEEML